jgi:hypothetical protein
MAIQSLPSNSLRLSAAARWVSIAWASWLAASADQAEVMAAFDAQCLGRVRWQGQRWAEVHLDSAQGLTIGQRATVMGREGTPLQVLCRHGPSAGAYGSGFRR